MLKELNLEDSEVIRYFIRSKVDVNPLEISRRSRCHPKTSVGIFSDLLTGREKLTSSLLKDRENSASLRKVFKMKT